MRLFYSVRSVGWNTDAREEGICDFVMAKNPEISLKLWGLMLRSLGAEGGDEGGFISFSFLTSNTALTR